MGRSQADLCTSTENDVAAAAAGAPEALTPVWGAVTCEVQGVLQRILAKNKAESTQEMGVVSVPERLLHLRT